VTLVSCVILILVALPAIEARREANAALLVTIVLSFALTLVVLLTDEPSPGDPSSTIC